MAPPHAQGDPDRHVIPGFDASMTRMLGADLRLLYGIGVPIAMIVGLIVVCSPSTQRNGNLLTDPWVVSPAG